MNADIGLGMIAVAALYVVQAWLFYRAGWHHGRAGAYHEATETNRKIIERITADR